MAKKSKKPARKSRRKPNAAGLKAPSRAVGVHLELESGDFNLSEKDVAAMAATMRAELDRVRQLSLTAVASGHLLHGFRPVDVVAFRRKWDAASSAPAIESDQYWPATAFTGGGKNGAARLRMAAKEERKTKRVRSRKEDGTIVYNVADVRRWFPDILPDHAR